MTSTFNRTNLAARPPGRIMTCAVAAIPRLARAQTYPSRPVRLIVPFAPGGPTDVFARLMARKFTEQFGTPFYVENVVGAAGNAGSAQAAKAAPDGYTILLNVSA